MNLVQGMKWSARRGRRARIQDATAALWPGYQTGKRRIIASAVDGGVFAKARTCNPATASPWMNGSWNTLAVRRLANVGKMLDAGSTFNHDFLLERPPLRGADLTIMTLAPEKRCYWYKGYSYVFGDLRKTIFLDHAFDTIASISTIEHIGLNNTMLYTGDPADTESDENGFVPAVMEFKRILKPGGTCFISVPFGKRDNLGWYQVFDVSMIEKIVETFAPVSHRIDYLGTLSMDGPGMRRMPWRMPPYMTFIQVRDGALTWRHRRGPWRACS